MMDPTEKLLNMKWKSYKEANHLTDIFSSMPSDFEKGMKKSYLDGYAQGISDYKFTIEKEEEEHETESV